MVPAAIGLAALGMGFGAQAALASASAPNGDMLFRQRCAMCHSTSAGRQMPMGPNLSGVVGRKAGATPFNYSPALKKSGLTWTRTNLDRYLAAPARMVPGTKMVVTVPNAADRAALTAYLTSAK